MQTVQAKFKCESVTHFASSQSVTLAAAVGKGNEDFSKFTPYARLEMSITNPDALGFFKPGQEYTLDIKEVAPPVEAEPAPFPTHA